MNRPAQIEQTATRINADFARPVVLDTSRMPWIASPLPGVDRRMLDRVGGEVARATSIVRYAPASRFSEHGHELGEEFLVLEGMFSDEHGDFPAGTYVRNPPATRHAPHSAPGCIIFVKLRQFARDDLNPVCLDVHAGAGDVELAPGVSSMHLHRFGGEWVRALRFAPGSRLPALDEARNGGEELFLIDGDLHDREGRYASGSWQRRPGAHVIERASEGGALVYLKTGHLTPMQAADQ